MKVNINFSGTVYKPLILFVSYILVSLLISFYGPIQYYEYNRLIVFIYMSSFLILFGGGYILGVSKKNRLRLAPIESVKMKNVLTIVKLCILLTVFIKSVELVTLIVSKGDVLSISNMGKAYVESYEGYVRGVASHDWFYILKLFSALPMTVALILGVYYYKSITFRYKVCVFFIYFSIFIVNTIGSGKQKQFGDLLIFLFCILALKMVGVSKKIQKKTLMSLATLMLGGVVVLVYILKLRYAAVGISADNINEKAHDLINYDLDNFIFTIVGYEWGFPLTALSFYLSGGYYGLSLSLQLPFIWTYFIGNSYSMMVLFNKFLGAPFLLEDTYPYRVGQANGWDESKWHSVFPWFASDLTFIGTLFLFSLVAYLYAQVWKEAYRYGNPLSIVLFSVLTLGLVYVPGNNQLLHSPEGVISIFILLVTWLLFHKKYNFLLPVKR